MLSRKAVIRFGLLLMLYATVLLIPWPGVEHAYARVFRAQGNVFFSRFWFWPQGYVRFFDLNRPDLREAIDEATPGRLPRSFEPPRSIDNQDTLMVLMNRDHRSTFGQLRTNSRLMGYWPTVWLLALVLAKPMPWPQRGWALGWGLLLVHAFIAFRLSLLLAHTGFATRSAYALFHPGPLAMDVIQRAEEVFVQNPSASFVVPTFIWFLVSFTRRDWQALRQLTRGEMEMAKS